MAQRPETPFISLLNDPEWDAPFFKKLRRGETPEGPGHQAGFILNKSNQDGNSAIIHFLPILDTNEVIPENPTADRHLIADHFIGGDFIETRPIRYTYQTRGATRSEEARLTDLGNLYRDSGEDDYVLIQRHTTHIDRYRLFLIKRGTDIYDEVSGLTRFPRWGPLFVEQRPVSNEDMATVRTEMLRTTESPFVPVSPQNRQQQNKRMAIARDSVFRETLLEQYDYKCAVTGNQIQTPIASQSNNRLHEVEAAHVIPKKFDGSDDFRNGLILCRTLHWAFDQGLFGVNDRRQVIIPECVLAIPENDFLNKLKSTHITESKNPQLSVHPQAFAWHRKNILLPRDSSGRHG